MVDHRPLLVPLVVLVLATTAACSFSVGGSRPSVSRDRLAEQVAAELTREVGTAPTSVECPDDLPGEVGATTRCTLLAPTGTTYGVGVTVTAVEGSEVRFSIQVDDAPSG